MAEKKGAPETEFGRIMKARGRHTELFDWPVRKGEAPRKGRFVWLTDEEIVEAQAAATKYLRDELKLDEFQVAITLDRTLYAFEEARQILARALRSPENPGMKYATVEELRRHLEPDTRRALIELYNTFSQRVSPVSYEKEPGKIAGMIADLKALGPPAQSDYLSCCDIDTLRSIVLAQLSPSPPPPSSSSSDT